MRKPQFDLVTALLVVFFGLLVFRVCFEKSIPPLPPNRLANFPGDFLQSAVHQPIDWQPNFAAALRRCQQLKKPCLLVMGHSSSKLARLMDQQVFSNWSVAARINSTFVPVRIDLADQPQWTNAIFPLWRLKAPFVAGFQIAVLNSKGVIVKLFPPAQDASQIDPSQFLDDVLTVTADLDRPKAAGDQSADSLRQRDDLMELSETESQAPPQFDQFASELFDRSSNQFGAFAEQGYLRTLPLAWLYLSRVGRSRAATESLAPLLLSPATDVVRGGFFDTDESFEEIQVNFSRRCVLNAEMAAMLAELGRQQNSLAFTAYSRQTFDMLLRDLRADGLFCSFSSPDSGSPTDQSPSMSFPPSRVSELLNSSEASWASTHLNLGRFENRQSVPYLDSLTSMTQPMYEEVVRKLRLSERETVEKPQARYADVNGRTVAELCRCVRIWNDPNRFESLRTTALELDRFAVDGGVCHTPTPAHRSVFLGDYLAFVDGELQFFLASGDVRAFRHGLAVLRTAISLFYRAQDGQFFCVCPHGEGVLPASFDAPEVADSFHESLTASAIRLCHAYGRLVGPTAEGQRLVRLAGELVYKNAGLSVSLSPSMAGFYVAAADVSDPECAFAVGPDAKSLADELYRQKPARLVAPVLGPVRPDLAGHKAGIYLVSGLTVAGPFTLGEAVDHLPATLQVGVTPDR